MAYFKNYPVIHQFLKIHSIKLLSICEVLKTILNSVNTPEKKKQTRSLFSFSLHGGESQQKTLNKKYTRLSDSWNCYEGKETG